MASTGSSTCCPCDAGAFPPRPDIDAGLESLPRQIATFGAWRAQLLQNIDRHGALDGWEAREGDDPGVMMLEWWAYVLDVLGFYDARIANDSYLRTAERRTPLRRLVELLGYIPRPAVAAEVTLAAIADGARTVTVPAGSAVRSSAFDDEPPQVFETESDTVIDPALNELPLAPLRDDDVGNELLFAPGDVRLARGQIVLIDAGSEGVHAATVSDLETVERLDGQTYTRATLDSPPPIASAEREGVTIAAMALAAYPNPFLESPWDDATSTLTLDSVYARLRTGDVVVVEEKGGTLVASEIEAKKATVAVFTTSDNDPVEAAFTQVTLTSDPDQEPIAIHFGPVDVGSLSREARTSLTASDLAGTVDLDGLLEAPEADTPTEIMLEDAKGDGVLSNGSLVITDGSGTYKADDPNAFDEELPVPVAVRANLLAATRGETVTDEVLGSGDPTQEYQSFRLAKSPLTYVDDPSAESGRRSTLSVRVDGIEWTEVSTFYAVASDDRVYIVRHDGDGNATITFGGGARPTGGVNNIVASYRFGAGAALPPAGAITQIASAVSGLRRVLNPVPASGGADADSADELRKDAPRSALTLDRAVSLLDFEALARAYSGIRNASATWSWRQNRQTAMVVIWFIPTGGDPSESLRDYLAARASDVTSIEARDATPDTHTLDVDLIIESGYDDDDVAQSVSDTLTNEDSGPLAVEVLEIGKPLYRSRLARTIASVPGVAGLRSLTLDGAPMPWAVGVEEGHYPLLTVGVG